MGKRVCSLVCAGSETHKKELRELIKNRAAFLIAVDGGMDNLPQGLKPDLFVGDLDSTKKSESQIKALAKEVVILNKDKDESDFEKALSLAYQKGFKDFLVFGAIDGKRSDMFLSNLQVCAKYSLKGLHITLFGKDLGKKINILSKGESLSVTDQKTHKISVLSLQDKSSVSIKGFKYEYEGTLTNMTSQGISNETVPGKEGNIKVAYGIIAVFYPVD